MSEMSELLPALEALADAVAGLEGVERYSDAVEAAGADAIAEVSARLGYPVPGAVADLWTRGFRAFSGSVEGGEFLAIGWDWVGPELALRELGGARQLAADHWADADPDDLEPDAEAFVDLLRDGLPLSFENPALFADRQGAVWLVNYKDCRADALGDLPKFLRDWASAGFLRQADSAEGVDAYLARVAELVPARLAVDPAENRWLALYRRLFW